MLENVVKAGYLSPEVVCVDGMHIKASTNLNKRIKQAIPQASKNYEKHPFEADKAIKQLIIPYYQNCQ